MVKPRVRQVWIERASTDDVMSLVSDRDDPPMQVGAVLLLDVGDHFDAGLLGEVLRQRVVSVPRLRQRLIVVPFGCGRPVWVDDPGFEFDEHFSVVHSPGPVDEESVLAGAVERLTTRLPRDRPLWAATLLTGLGDGRSALVFVFHHVLADGIAGLSVLGRLVDGPQTAAGSDFARPAPSLVRLAMDAAGSRVRSILRLPVMLRRLSSAVVELGPSLRTQATPCSLNRPTGTHRRLGMVRSDLAPVIRLAHQNGATVNDVILTAITAALHLLLVERGEHVPAFVVSIPVSSRPQALHGELGNQSGVVPVLLSATGAFPDRLASTCRATRDAKHHPRGASTALLGPVFRLLARLGIYQRFIDHQRLIHTFVSNLRGPETALTLLGYPITGVIPLSVATGNVTVSFTALSYAGSLVITIGADPDTCPDFDRLQQLLQHQLSHGLESLADDRLS
jgi:diacylglycerol O-acyltransferase / wax synthase